MREYRIYIYYVPSYFLFSCPTAHNILNDILSNIFASHFTLFYVFCVVFAVACSCSL